MFKKGCDDMLNIIKEELDLSPDLKKKIDWAKNYTSTSITLEKGHLIRLEPSNLAYVDPHKVKINNYTFLFFNGINSKNLITDKEHRVIFNPPKTINKSEINKALSSINRQMDEAADEFYQTNKKDDYYL